MNAAIYARISQDSSGEGQGVERQRIDCEELAKARGWHVAGVYVDNDISAYSGKPRPQYRRLLGDIQGGRVEAILAWHTDRLHRSPRELEEFIDICEAHQIQIETVRGGVLDLGSSTGRGVARLMGVTARMASEQAGERIARKKDELAQRGKPSGGGVRAYGYGPDRMTVVPDEAAILRETAERVLAGESLRGIAADLNRRGVPAVRGRGWRYGPLRNMLMRPRLTGDRTHRGDIAGKAAWEPILTDSQGARIRHLLSDPGRRCGRISQRYLLTGLLYCDVCHHRMAGGKTYSPRYACPDSHVGISAHALDDFITEAVLSSIDSRSLSNAREGDQTKEQEAALAVIQSGRAELKELAGLHGRGRFTLAEWLGLRDGIERRIAAAESVMGRVSPSTLGNKSEEQIRAEWPSLSLDRRRAIIGTLIERVTILPVGKGKRFTSDRLVVEWRL